MKPIQHRKTVILLIMITLIVWSIIILKLTGFTGVQDQIMLSCDLSGNGNHQGIDTLLLDYRDPFKEYVTEIPVRVESVDTKQKEIVLEPPTFRMTGKIRKGVKDFLLIEGVEGTQLISKSEKIEGFKIIYISDDSVVLRKCGKDYILNLN